MRRDKIKYLIVVLIIAILVIPPWATRAQVHTGAGFSITLAASR